MKTPAWKNPWWGLFLRKSVGFNFCISRLSIYLYEKTIFAWHESQIKVILDFGLAAGIYFKDERR